MTEETKVMFVTMHLVDNAKLWLKSSYIDILDGRCIVDTWERLKQGFAQSCFYVEILARQKSRELKHAGNI